MKCSNCDRDLPKELVAAAIDDAIDIGGEIESLCFYQCNECSKLDKGFLDKDVFTIKIEDMEEEELIGCFTIEIDENKIDIILNPFIEENGTYRINIKTGTWEKKENNND